MRAVNEHAQPSYQELVQGAIPQDSELHAIRFGSARVGAAALCLGSKRSVPRVPRTPAIAVTTFPVAALVPTPRLTPELAFSR